jgi:tetratricopeptide (TPR) repeat protein
MTDHCLISYSGADGLEFASRLADELQGQHPFIKTWLDKRELSASSPEDWDDQIANAIKSCKCVVFVMTVDSTAEGSVCKDEWTWALKYKKPVITLRQDRIAEIPFRLSNHQHVDFSEDFDVGIAQLRTAIKRLDSPEGILDQLRRRLAAANRDLRRAKDEDKLRIQAEIDELKKQIETQQKIVDDPQAAEEQTKKSIEAGLERERKPEKPVAAKTETKFINPPPGIAPTYFQDREVENKEVVKFLNNDSQRMITIIGRGGVGKTAMVCRLLKGLEGGELPDDLGEMKVDGIVYLSESGSHRVNFANIYYDLCKLLPSEVAQELDAVYKNPQASTESKMRALLEKFGGERVALLLDNFEPLVDTETFAIRDAELDEALRAFLNGTHTAVNIVITTRVAPRTLNLLQPGRQRGLTLDEGLESPYAENILREMDSDGRMGLKSASDDLLSRARERTRGYPRALEALFAILASDRYTTLEELLDMPTPENVVEALVGEAFNRLDTNAQKVIQALAVYNRPVPPAAVDYLLTLHLPTIDSAPILQRLANMHFARKESGKFYLHPVDREFAFGLLAKGDEIAFANPKQAQLYGSLGMQPSRKERNDFTRIGLTDRAADYFAQARKPRAEWKKLEDLAAQLAEFDLRYAADDYDTAASVLDDIDFDYLFLWGHFHLLIQMREKLQTKIRDIDIVRNSTGSLGNAYLSIGKTREAINNFETALKMAKLSNNPYAEVVWLNSLGLALIDLGEARKAIEFYEEALVIAHEIGNRQAEESTLGNLGGAYKYLGDTRKAIEYQEQALTIDREIGDRRGEAADLGNLGNRYEELGESYKAIEFYQQSLVIARDIGDRLSESINLVNAGLVYLSLGDHKKAEESHRQAIQIADEILYPEVQQEARWGLANAYLFQNDLVNARATIEAALQYDMPKINHKASALHGIIALRQGDGSTASEAFTRSIVQAVEILAKTPDYYDALDAKGLALCGLALCDGEQHIPAALETFRAARKIAPHAGIVERVLRLFEELVKCDEEGVLGEVRKAAEGSEIQT